MSIHVETGEPLAEAPGAGEKVDHTEVLGQRKFLAVCVHNAVGQG